MAQKVSPGALVQARKGTRMGIVVEVFPDLNPHDPWVRICWTHPKDTYEWCKLGGLEIVDPGAKDKGDD
jgi:hypothetical protein|tara:strand:+ start:1437 stop:1643 length:207 start_codon:yes stop_codon:yes gene_type:complete